MCLPAAGNVTVFKNVSGEILKLKLIGLFIASAFLFVGPLFSMHGGVADQEIVSPNAARGQESDLNKYLNRESVSCMQSWNRMTDRNPCIAIGTCVLSGVAFFATLLWVGFQANLVAWEA